MIIAGQIQGNWQCVLIEFFGISLTLLLFDLPTDTTYKLPRRLTNEHDWA